MWSAADRDMTACKASCAQQPTHQMRMVVQSWTLTRGPMAISYAAELQPGLYFSALSCQPLGSLVGYLCTKACSCHNCNQVNMGLCDMQSRSLPYFMLQNACRSSCRCVGIGTDSWLVRQHAQTSDDCVLTASLGSDLSRSLVSLLTSVQGRSGFKSKTHLHAQSCLQC